MNIKGYTIIELLVVITIMLVVLGGGIASFSEFNDRQQVTTAAKDIQTMLRAAQIKAKSGEGSGTDVGSCDAANSGYNLRGYQVTTEVVNEDTFAVMDRICINSEGLVSSSVYLERSRNLLEGVIVNTTTGSNLFMEFYSLKGGVRLDEKSSNLNGITVTVTGIGNNLFDFEVSSLGEITQGEYQ